MAACFSVKYLTNLKSDASRLVLCTNYSSWFGEEFTLPENQFDGYFLNTLYIFVVEECIPHVHYVAASQVIYAILSTKVAAPRYILLRDQSSSTYYRLRTVLQIGQLLNS